MPSIEVLINEIVDKSNAVFTLRPQVTELVNQLKMIINTDALMNENIVEGETETNTGLAVSPTMAIMCADDFARTVQFIRALHSAIIDVNQRKPNVPAQVLYAGTGPLATLAIPLMQILSKHQATFTLLDIHQESIDSVKQLLKVLNLEESVNAIVKVDAFDYEIDKRNSPDIIILEIMQACLAKEPQVAVSHHLIKQAPDAILIPQKINVELMMVDIRNEFQFNDGSNKPTRVKLGTALSIDKEQLLDLPSEEKLSIPSIAIQIPNTIPEHLEAKLFTTITTYKDHILKDYDSGLTCPREITCDEKYSSGDTLKFSYKMSNQPELKAVVINSH